MQLYVGNLNYNLNETTLQGLFTQYGEVVSAKIITDQFSGQSKGFGFIEMEDSAAGQKAMSELNGQVVEGRPLKVNEAVQKSNNKRRY